MPNPPPTDPAPAGPEETSGGEPTIQGAPTRKTMAELHADPRHWKLAIFYVCREDPRVLVPKRIRGLGWTVNLARPATYFAVVFLYFFVWSTVKLAHAAGASHEAIL